MADVSLENVTKRFGDVAAVDGLDLRVEDRELLVLVGPSGCGKTTTLRVIAGLEDVTDGVIRIGGSVVNDVAPRRRDVAMVFQHFALYPHLNVYRNMAFGLKMRRTPKTEIDRRIRETARSLEIEDLLDRKPAQLSGGQRQRVALGRAIVRQPQVFLFDEPLSNLDTQLRVSMRRELVRLQRQLETTMIHVTHDQVEAMMMGGRIAVMHGGRILQTGRPEEIYDSPANRFVAEFIGTPPMNLLNGTVRFADGTASFEADGFSLAFSAANRSSLEPWTGKQVTLGFRPEGIAFYGEPGTDWTRLSAEVLATRSMGPDTLLDLQHGSVQFAASRRPRTDLCPGESMDIFIDPAKCHVFDAVTGNAILR